MKNCPFCGEAVHESAIKCKNCREWINKNELYKRKYEKIKLFLYAAWTKKLRKIMKLTLIILFWIGIVGVVIFIYMNQDNRDTGLKNKEIELLENRSPLSLVSDTKNSPYYQEFIAWDTIQINTKDYPKSSGIDLIVAYPKSWNISPGTLPNTVSYASSPIDKNSQQIGFTILIKKNSENITLQSLKEKRINAYQGENWWEYQEWGYTSIKNQTFAWSIYRVKTERVGANIYAYSLSYNTIIQNKFVQFQFMTLGNISIGSELDNFFQKKVIEQYLKDNIPLFNLIMNSITINNH